jgi:hypothetical protein
MPNHSKDFRLGNTILAREIEDMLQEKRTPVALEMSHQEFAGSLVHGRAATYALHGK